MGGGRLGPDLSDAGLQYTREHIREALLDPTGTVAEGRRGVKGRIEQGRRARGYFAQ